MPFRVRADAARDTARDAFGVTTMKTHRFPVDVHWQGGRQTRLTAPGRPGLTVATPPEFRGIEGVWSPEHLLVGSVASCYAVTLAAIADRRGLPLRALDVRAAGDVTRRLDGRLGFTVVELEVVLETDRGHEPEARAAAEDAERACLIAASLDTPVHVELEIRTASAAA